MFRASVTLLAKASTFPKGIVKQIFYENRFSDAIQQFYKHPNPFDASFLVSKSQISMYDCEQIFKVISPQNITIGLLVNMIKMYQRNNVGEKDYLWDELVNLLNDLPKEALERQMNQLTWNVVLGGLCSSGRTLIALHYIERARKRSLPTFEVDKKTISYILSKSVDDPNTTSHMMNNVLEYMNINNLSPDIIDYTAYLKKLINEKNIVEIEQLTCRKGVEFDNIFYSKVFSACTKFGSISNAQNFYNQFTNLNITPNQYIYSSLIRMLTKFGFNNEAFEVFNKMKNGCGIDSVTFVIMVNSLIEADNLDQSLKLIKDHLSLLDSTIIFRILNSLTKETKELEKSEKIFFLLDGLFHLSTRDHGRYIEMMIINKQLIQAIDHYRMMIKGAVQVDEHIMCSLFNGISNFDCEKEVALEIFNSMNMKMTPILASNTIKMFAKYGMLDQAKNIFNETKTSNDIVLWNSMLGSYGSNNQIIEVLSTFKELTDRNIEPNAATFVTIFTACANSGCVNQGKELLSLYKIQIQQLRDATITSSIINMFAKCGDFENALSIFKSIQPLEITTPIVNVMISAYSKHGKGVNVLELFNQFFTGHTSISIRPNAETFLCLLYACSHCNLIDQAVSIYQSMYKDYQITPNMTHNTALIDAFSRNGFIDEAEIMANKFKKKDVVLFMSLLGACRKHLDVERAERVFHQILQLNDRHTSAYVLMANIYSGSGLLGKAMEIREQIERKGLIKIPGQSYLEIDGKIESFVSQDNNHPRHTEIYAELFKLMQELEDAGYSPDTSWVTKSGVHDDEEKKKLLCLHSEKIAMAYAFITQPPGSTITIFNNLRVCGDCHTATKFISKVRKCKIIVRDASRFHHFEDGKCSCGDKW